MLNVKTLWDVFPICLELITLPTLSTLTFPALFSVKIPPMFFLTKLLNAKVTEETFLLTALS